MTDTSGSTTHVPLEFQFFTLVGIIAQLSQNLLARRLPHGMTMAQFTVLSHFARFGEGRTLVELSRAFQVTKGAMTNTVTRLNSKGFVSVTPDPGDGRAKQVMITPAGRDAYRQCIESLADVMQTLGTEVPRERFSSAIPFLQELAGWLDVHREI